MNDKKAKKEPPPEIDRLAKIAIGYAIKARRTAKTPRTPRTSKEKICDRSTVFLLAILASWRSRTKQEVKK